MTFDPLGVRLDRWSSGLRSATTSTESLPGQPIDRRPQLGGNAQLDRRVKKFVSASGSFVECFLQLAFVQRELAFAGERDADRFERREFARGPKNRPDNMWLRSDSTRRAAVEPNKMPVVSASASNAVTSSRFVRIEL